MLLRRVGVEEVGAVRRDQGDAELRRAPSVVGDVVEHLEAFRLVADRDLVQLKRILRTREQDKGERGRRGGRKGWLNLKCAAHLSWNRQYCNQLKLINLKKRLLRGENARIGTINQACQVF